MQSVNSSVLQYASPWKRLAAFAIDIGVSLLAGIPLFLVIRLFEIELTILNRSKFDAIGYLIWWLYFALMEASRYQGTVGKIALSLRVTDLAGQPIGIGRATGRHFAKLLSVLTLCVGLFMALFTKKRQCLHDTIGGTLVLDISKKPAQVGINNAQSNFVENKPPSVQVIGDLAYEGALAELEEDRKHKATWARCFANSGGDEAKAQAEYIRIRALALSVQPIESTDISTSQNNVTAGSEPNGHETTEAVPVQAKPTNSVAKWAPSIVAILAFIGILFIVSRSSKPEQIQLAENAPAIATMPVGSKTDEITSVAMTPNEKFKQTPETKPPDLFTRAMAGDIDAQIAMGKSFRTNDGGLNGANRSIEWFRKAAEQGSSEAKYQIGLRYSNRGHYDYGPGVDQDLPVAAKWFQQAADAGHSRAQCDLGHMYEYGMGVPKDYSKALKLYKSAADQGNANGINSLGSMYFEGKGVARNYVKAAELYLKGANLGDSPSKFDLGNMYLEGKGVVKNPDTALRYFEEAAAKGYPLALGQIGYVGSAYFFGDGVQKDPAKAFKLLQKAAGAGGVGAHLAEGVLGYMYGSGVGVPKDAVLAYAWTTLAAIGKNDVAARNLGVFERVLSNTEKYEAIEILRSLCSQTGPIGQRLVRNKDYTSLNATERPSNPSVESLRCWSIPNQNTESMAQ